MPRTKKITTKERGKRKSTCESLLKGKLFEIIIIQLLEKSWFSQNVYSTQLTQNRKKLHWSWATYDHDYCWALSIWIPFLNPIMLVWEAKFHKVALKTAREFLGAYTDLSQYTKINTKAWWASRYNKLYEPRYNYSPVMFSYKWFLDSAKWLLYTHGINFISYNESKIFKDLEDKYSEILKLFKYENFKPWDMKKFFDKANSVNDLSSIDTRLVKQGYSEKLAEISDYITNIRSYIGVLDNRFTVNILTLRNKEEKRLFEFGKHSSLYYAWKWRFEIRTKKWKTVKAEFYLPESFFEKYYKNVVNVRKKSEEKITQWRLKRSDYIDPLSHFCKSLSVVITHWELVDVIWRQIDQESRDRIIDTLEEDDEPENDE